MKKLMILLGIVGVFFSCSSPTEITGSWRNPQNQSRKYDNIMIAALTENINAKATVENDLSLELQSEGVKTSKSIEAFPPNFKEDQNNKEAMLDKVRNNGTDAILTITLIDKETETRYVPGNYGYDPIPRFGFYGMFWPYYTYWYPRVYTPGYYEEDKIYFLEINLYDAKTEQIVWSAQSETYNPSSLATFSQDFADLIVQKLKQENILVGS
jgi:hypothetical protein